MNTKKLATRLEIGSQPGHKFPPGDDERNATMPNKRRNLDDSGKFGRTRVEE